MQHQKLISKYPLISDQVDRHELGVLLAELEKKIQSAEVHAIVEFGCYIGTTSVFIRRLLDAYVVDANFHVYDSFAGLPEKSSHDMSPAGEQFKRGELSVSKKEFQLQFKKAGLKPPTIHKGWFSELKPEDIPDYIDFAFLDGDYYESVMTPLRLIWPKLRPGAVVVVDDYANEALPGASRAVDEWVRSHSASLSVIRSLAIIKL
jgi:O-methyltransferase